MEKLKIITKRKDQWFWTLDEKEDIQDIHAGDLNILPDDETEVA